MTTLFLIRHATVDAVGKSIAGWMPGVHLSPQGHLEAQRVADWMGHRTIAAIYASPLERASETAGYISARLGIPVTACESLGEVSYGDWTGRQLEELAGNRKWQLFNSFRSFTRVPGGELMLEVQTRIVAELERLRELHPAEELILISHGDVIRAAVGYVAGVPIDLLHRIEISPASVSIIGMGDDHARVLCVNATDTWLDFGTGKS